MQKRASGVRSAIKPIEDRSMLGIGLVLMAVLMFTGIDTSAKWLVLSGVPPFQVAFVRYAMALILVMVVLWPSQRAALFHTERLGLEIVRALAVLMSSIFNFTALQYLPLTVTASIAFTAPLVLCALSVPMLGEKVGWRRWAAILVGFAGALIIIRPGGADFHWAMFLALGAASGYALYSIFNRKLAGIDSPYTQQFYNAFIGTLCLIPFAFWNWVWPSDVPGWIAFFMLGVFGSIGHYLVTLAHRYAEASTLAPFNYFQMIYMSIASWLVYDQLPSIWIYVGAPIVVGSGLYIWNRERVLAAHLKASEGV